MTTAQKQKPSVSTKPGKIRGSGLYHKEGRDMDEQQDPPEHSYVSYGDGTAVYITQEGDCS